MTRRRIPAALAASLAAAVLVLAGCSAGQEPPERVPAQPSSPAAPPSASATDAATDADAGAWRPAGDLDPVARGLRAPWSVVPFDDGSFVVSQRDTGEILELAPGADPRVVGVVEDAASGGEGGLLGLAIDGSAADDAPPWLYAYVSADVDNRVLRMPLSGDAGERALGAPEVVLSGIPRAGIHNGGRIAFGPDGLLYVATGDAAEPALAQNPDSLAGKILRLTPEGAPAPENASGGAVYSLGHRNVQGLAWTADGTMWASEFGQDAVDELNRIEEGGNYGWPAHEGAAGAEGFIDPVVQWQPSEASPSGLAARGGTLFAAGLRGERVWMIDTAGGAVVGEPEAAWTGELGRVRDAVVAGDELLLLTSNTDGRARPGPDDDRLLRVALEAVR